jgi:hypothetical protein
VDELHERKTAASFGDLPIPIASPAYPRVVVAVDDEPVVAAAVRAWTTQLLTMLAVLVMVLKYLRMCVVYILDSGKRYGKVRSNDTAILGNCRSKLTGMPVDS